jgi:hypothetical protein
VSRSQSALLFVITSPVGPYYKTGFDAVRLYAGTKYVRAWPGGTGDAKVGGYARTPRNKHTHTHTQAHTGTYIKHKQRGRRPPTNQPNRYVYTHTVSSSHRQRDGDGANA